MPSRVLKLFVGVEDLGLTAGHLFLWITLTLYYALYMPHLPKILNKLLKLLHLQI